MAFGIHPGVKYLLGRFVPDGDVFSGSAIGNSLFAQHSEAAAAVGPVVGIDLAQLLRAGLGRAVQSAGRA